MKLFASLWDSFELWLANLPYVPQIIVLLGVMVPIAFALALAADTVIGGTQAAIERFTASKKGANRSE